MLCLLGTRIFIIIILMSLLFVGKLLIATGLCLQAYMLFDNPVVVEAFNTKLATLLSSCQCVPPEAQVLLKEYLRFVIVGLLAMSIPMVVLRSSFIKILVLLGLATLMFVRRHPLTEIPSFKEHTFWESIAILGGLIHLIGVEASMQSKPKKKQKSS